MSKIKYWIFLFSILFLIFLTPVFKVFAKTEVSGEIFSDTTWTIDASPYVVTSPIAVMAGATLYIDPGVIVKFDNNSGIYVFGDLVVNGEGNNKVYFTSYYDDSIGGDTDEDYFCYDDIDDDGNTIGEICGSYNTPMINDWQGINFYNSYNNYIKNAVFKYTDGVSYLDHSYLNLKNVDISDSADGIMTNVSDIDADNLNFNNLSGSCLVEMNNSNINWANSMIDTVFWQEAISVFNSSKLNLSHFYIKNILDNLALSVFDNSILNADDVHIENVSSQYSTGMYIFNNSHVSLNHFSFKDCLAESCIMFFDGDSYIDKPSSLDIKNSIFDTGLGSGILTFGDGNLLLNIEKTVIKNFPNFGIESYASFVVHAENNYWGDASGPYNLKSNLNGLGNAVSDNVSFAPWCDVETCAPPVVRDPIIVIPGITATYLYKNYDDLSQIWPNLLNMIFNIKDLFLNDLALEPDGTENPARPIKVGDIVRGAVGVHVFDELLDTLTSDGYVENTDLFVFPYDWRKSTSENAILLKDKIEAVLATTGKNKVDILAHSMGGLLAKKYIADNGIDKIDQLIFFGTPQLGSPKAFKILMFGDDMGFNLINASPFHFLKPERAKYISQNMPSVYELLPSEKYIDENGSYVINKEDLANIFFLDSSETKDFMIQKGRNTAMFPFAKNLHDSIDNLDLSNIKIYNFVGCGSATIGEITVKKKRSWKKLWLGYEDDFDIKYTNGDSTVPIASAEGVNTNEKYFVKNIEHGSLPSGEGLKQDVSAILKGEDVPDSPIILKNTDNCKIAGEIVSVHSPVQMHIYDESGAHTGPSMLGVNPDTDGDIEYGIPGVEYDVLDGEKFAFLPEGKNYKIVTRAEDTGGYNFEIKKEDKNENIVADYNWTLLPLKSLQANGEIWIGPDHPASEYVVKMDDDGNGIFDKDYPVSYDGTSDAEKMINPKSAGSSGSILSFKNILPLFVQNDFSAEKSVETKEVLKVVTLDNNKKEININKDDNKNEGQNNLTATVVNAKVKNNFIWPVVLGILFIILILAKKFKKS